MILVDSHCHLHEVSNDLNTSIECVITEAQEHDVQYILTVSTNSNDINTSIEVTNANKNVFCAVGIHPEHAAEYYDIKTIESHTTNPKVVAIGEIGLDFFYDTVDHKTQINVFEQMLNIAPELPRVIHARDCIPEILDIIKNNKNAYGVFHCYTDSLENVKKVLDLGFYISFSGIATFKKASALREVAKYVPCDRILIETDAPFLAPEPFRGTVNQPAYVKQIAVVLSSERNVPIQQFAEQTTTNFFNCFKKAKL